MRRIGVLTGAPPKAIRTLKPAKGYSARRCSNWVGPKDATFDTSTVRGPAAMSILHAETRRNWSRSARTSFWLEAPELEAVQQATRTIPIVFAGLTDPVGAGFVESLARPGGNTTGFTSFEYGLSAKWVELLKEIAPRVTRVGVLREQGSSVGIGLGPRCKAQPHPLGWN